MAGRRSARDVLHNLLLHGDLSFRDFVEIALYHPETGYYARADSPVGKEGDFVTAPALSPVFAHGFGKLVRDFVRRSEAALCSIVDIGCGDGSLIRTLHDQADAETRARAFFAGIDRSLERVRAGDPGVSFHTSILELPPTDACLIYSNELFDALPFARLVRRGEELHELWVHEGENGELDWSEREAPGTYEHYFAERGIELLDGQFADVSLDWAEDYRELARRVERGLLVTFDYGFPEKQLFDPRIRRFGTAASYSRQRVTRDLLANPGEQDLTAHINFTDLIRAGEGEGLATLSFERQAKFLLSLGITDHELFAPVTDLQVRDAEEGLRLLDARDEARRLVLPDGIGQDIRVLVQGRGVPLTGWSFQQPLY